MASAEQQLDLKSVWLRVTEEVKRRIIYPPLWEAMEIATPLALEDATFVVGSNPRNASKMVQITALEHRIIIDQILTKAIGSDTHVRLIEGDTSADWESAKARDQALKDIEETKRQRRGPMRPTQMSWDVLYERLSRMYADLEFRQFPQVQAAYVLEAVDVIKAAVNELKPEWTGSPELWERSLARAIDKVATLANIPAATVALELAHVLKNA